MNRQRKSPDKSPDNRPDTAGAGELVRQSRGGAIRSEIPSVIPSRLGKNGGRLRTGNPGGGGGRPRDAFKQLCRELASGERTVENVRAILDDPKHPLFLGALKWATEHGYGKATERHEVTGANGGPVVHRWRFGDRDIEF